MDKQNNKDKLHITQISNTNIKQTIESNKSDQNSKNVNQKQLIQTEGKQAQNSSKNDNYHQQKYRFNKSIQNSENLNQDNQISNQKKQTSFQKQNRQRRLYTFNFKPENDNIKSKQVHQIENQLKQIESAMKRKSVIIEVDDEFSQRKSDKFYHQTGSNNHSNEHENKDFTPPFHNQIAQDARRNTQILFIPNFSDVGRINEQEQKQFNSDSQQSDSDQYQNYKSQQKKNTAKKENSQNNEDEDDNQQEEQKNTEVKETKQKMTPKFDNRQNTIEFTQTKSKPVIQPIMSFNIQRKQQVKPQKIRNCKCNLI